MADFKEQLSQYAQANNMNVKPPQGQQPQVAQKPVQQNIAVKPKFLNEGADYVTIAEKTMESLRRPDRRTNELTFGDLTTSKIRNILSMVNQIYNDVVLTRENTLSPELVDRIRYMKVRLVYESGREVNVKAFAEKSGIIKGLDFIGSSKSNFMRYAKYLEALTAYHRFFGGKDN